MYRERVPPVAVTLLNIEYLPWCTLSLEEREYAELGDGIMGSSLEKLTTGYWTSREFRMRYWPRKTNGNVFNGETGQPGDVGHPIHTKAVCSTNNIFQYIHCHIMLFVYKQA